MIERRMARADLAAGAVFLVLAVAVTYGSWTMDRLELRRIHPLSAPGLTPGLLGIALAVASLLLIAKAVGEIRTASKASQSLEAESGNNPGAVGRLLAATALCLIYALGLVGRMPFWLATATFVAAFIAFFEWESGAPTRRRATRLGWAIFLGLATGFAVEHVFRDFFFVRLP